MKMIIHIFFIIISIVSSISFASVQDFCVADLNGPQSPSGYSCKNPNHVTVNDFVFSGLAKAGNTSNINKLAAISAFAPNFTGLNGLGVSLARLDFAVGGVAPLHTHPGASEVIFVIQGTLKGGFISSSNKVYLKTLKTGDSMVFPQGLIHFVLNSDKGHALVLSAFGSSYPGIQVIPYALFANDFPTELIEATSFLSDVEVKRLKGVFGGVGEASL